MITAVDTNVLIDVFGNDPRHGAASADVLRRCLHEGTLVACDVVWAETRAAFALPTAFADAMQDLGVQFSALNVEAAAQAGDAWRAYRKAGGGRARMVADFMIGAHASHQADRLLTRDRGYYRLRFKGLHLIEPSSAA